MTKNNGGFYFSEEVGFEPDIEKKEDKRGDKKDGRNNKNKKGDKQKK